MATSFPVLATASTDKVLVAASSNILHILVRQAGADETYTATLPAPKSIRQLAISPDSSHIVAVDDSKNLYVFTTPSSTSAAELLNTRTATKKCASITFSPDGQTILYSDKVGDVYSYPLTVSAPSEAQRPSSLAVQTDPTINPDASLLLGHVSVITDAICATTSTGKGRIITSDRDEHIRISRYPLAYVVDKYLFGSEGFVSAIHIASVPPTDDNAAASSSSSASSSKSTLLSAGGERWMWIWDWEAGVQVGRVDVMSAVLPHRRVRAPMRKDKRKNPPPAPAGREDGEETFYSAPEGWLLPIGQGILIKKILSVQVEGKTVVVFFSEGAAALHAFTLPNGSSPSEVFTLPLDSPVLDIALLPGSSDLFVSLDTAFGVLKHNQSPKPPTAAPEPGAEAVEKMSRDTTIISISSDGTLAPSSSANPLAASLKAEANLATVEQLSKIVDIYSDLGLLPKWMGEDAEEAGEPANGAGTDGASDAGTTSGGPGGRSPFSYSPDELAAMPVKQLGRLKAQGVDVQEYIAAKSNKKKGSSLNPNNKQSQEQQEAKRRKTEDGSTTANVGEEGSVNA